MAGEMLVSTDECAGMDGGHSIDTDGNARDEGDKILTAGPSAWESTKKNLVSNSIFGNVLLYDQVLTC